MVQGFGNESRDSLKGSHKGMVSKGVFSSFLLRTSKCNDGLNPDQFFHFLIDLADVKFNIQVVYRGTGVGFRLSPSNLLQKGYPQRPTLRSEFHPTHSIYNVGLRFIPVVAPEPCDCFEGRSNRRILSIPPSPFQLKHANKVQVFFLNWADLLLAQPQLKLAVLTRVLEI